VTVHVKGDGFGPDANITIEFDLLFSVGQSAFGKPVQVAITDANLRVSSTGSWDDDGAEADVRAAWPGVSLGFQIDVDALIQPLIAAFPDLQNYLGRCCDSFDVEVGADGSVTLSASLSPAPAGGFPWGGTVILPKSGGILSR
jgi:hypothetical protein